MEYIIYCDESVTDGKYYSDFFGGVLVRSGDFDKIKDTLEAKKQELNLLNEIPKGILDNSIPSLEIPPRRIQRAEMYIKKQAPLVLHKPLKWN